MLHQEFPFFGYQSVTDEYESLRPVFCPLSFVTGTRASALATSNLTPAGRAPPDAFLFLLAQKEEAEKGHSVPATSQGE
jgi:hypothetical protein